jgi:nicotinate-nucleotide pyrophosphorylase (carboxylating)
MSIHKEELNRFITNAIREDIGDGDHTSQACIPADRIGKAKLLVKEEGILAGVEVAKTVFAHFDPLFKLDILLNDGTLILPGDIAFIVEGPVVKLLQAERLVLNIMQRMSGIATQTRVYVDRISGTRTRILDTRKTTPGMRFLEKEAVKIGGGFNHRIGLFDMILIKDNHIDFAGGIRQAIKSVRYYLDNHGLDLPVEVEVRNFDDIAEVISTGHVNRVMFDNFSPADTLKAVEMIGGRFETESSGGIRLENIRDYALAGVDFISVGALTHQIKSLDLSLKAIDF